LILACLTYLAVETLFFVVK